MNLEPGSVDLPDRPTREQIIELAGRLSSRYMTFNTRCREAFNRINEERAAKNEPPLTYQEAYEEVEKRAEAACGYPNPDSKLNQYSLRFAGLIWMESQQNANDPAMAPKYPLFEPTEPLTVQGDRAALIGKAKEIATATRRHFQVAYQAQEQVLNEYTARGGNQTHELIMRGTGYAMSVEARRKALAGVPYPDADLLLMGPYLAMFIADTFQVADGVEVEPSLYGYLSGRTLLEAVWGRLHSRSVTLEIYPLDGVAEPGAAMQIIVRWSRVINVPDAELRCRTVLEREAKADAAGNPFPDIDAALRYILDYENDEDGIRKFGEGLDEAKARFNKRPDLDGDRKPGEGQECEP